MKTEDLKKNLSGSLQTLWTENKLVNLWLTHFEKTVIPKGPLIGKVCTGHDSPSPAFQLWTRSLGRDIVLVPSLWFAGLCYAGFLMSCSVLEGAEDAVIFSKDSSLAANDHKTCELWIWFNTFHNRAKAFLFS